MYGELADRHINNTDDRLVDWLINFIRLFGTNRAEYKRIVKEIASCRELSKTDASFMEGGMFAFRHIMTYAISKILEEKTFQYPHEFKQSMLGKLYRYAISSDMSEIERYPDAPDYDIWLIDKNIAMYACLDCLDNAVRGINWTISKYSKALCHIPVENQEGDERGGTGFIVRADRAGSDKWIAVTNKHVVDPSLWTTKSIVVAGKNLSTGKIHTSEANDLAAIEIDGTTNIPSFSFQLGMFYLQNIITIGYPFISRINDNVMMVHSGQVNGFADTREGERLMFISADVPPGSSGGPVLNELGLVIGVTTQSNEGDYCVGGGAQQKVFRSVHHAAIPADVVVPFLNGIAFD